MKNPKLARSLQKIELKSTKPPKMQGISPFWEVRANAGPGPVAADGINKGAWL
jgi:hypothetical protein